MTKGGKHEQCCIPKASNHLDLSQLLLLLPVPNRQDVIVGVIHGAQERTAVLGAGGRQVREEQRPVCVRDLVGTVTLQPL